MTVTQYIGARYVPLFATPIEWSNEYIYDPLTIVLHGGDSYTSMQRVPKGIDISNSSYWAKTGNYNAQIEQYRNEVAAYVKDIDENAKEIISINARYQYIDVVAMGVNNEGVETSAKLQDIINSVITQDIYLYFRPGVYLIASPISIPTNHNLYLQGAYTENGSAYVFDPATGNPYINGSCIIYNGNDALFKFADTENNKLRNINNLMIMNATYSSGEYALLNSAALITQTAINHSTKGKNYINNCLFMGFKTCFGNIDTGSTSTTEYTSVKAHECAFRYNTTSLINLTDSTIEGCRFAHGGIHILFDSNTGFSTITSNRFEWNDSYGIAITNTQTHEISILNNEFDRTGDYAIYSTGSKRLRIVANVMRRSGALRSDINTSRHMYLEHVSELSMIANTTVVQNSQDDGSGTRVPVLPPYWLTSTSNKCTHIINVGNNWYGCTTPDSTLQTISNGES